MRDSEKKIWLFVCDCLFYQQIHSRHQLNLLSRIFLWICTNIRGCSRLFPIVNPKYIFMCTLQSRKDAVTAFASCESKSNLITIVSLSSSSNKLGNNLNFDSNLLIPISLTLISNKKVYLGTCCLVIIFFDVIRS